MHSLNLRGRLYEIGEPKVMGILNVTPDSFYAESRTDSEEEIAARVRQMVDEGADMIDIGGCSSRPGAADVSPEEEMARLRRGLRTVRRLCPDIPVSVDTYRADVARMCVEEEGADIVNDISGGTLDRQMFRTVARLGVPYVLTHIKGTPATMQDSPRYEDVCEEVTRFFADRLDCLCLMGAKDIILDPGFGFGKTLDDNYRLLSCLDDLGIFGLPVLVGVSRKSMVYNLTGGTPQTALNATTAVHTIALMKGAEILRVHDVNAAVEARAVFRASLGCKE